VAGAVEIGVRGYLDHDACPAELTVASITVPSTAHGIQKGVRRQLDFHAASVDLSVASIAIPSAAAGVQEGVRRYCDVFTGLVEFLIASLAFPIVSAVVEETMGRDLHGKAGLLDLPEPSIALPSTAVSHRMRMERRCCEIGLGRCRSRPDRQEQYEKGPSTGGGRSNQLCTHGLNVSFCPVPCRELTA
jgi:hypothetical protein